MIIDFIAIILIILAIFKGIRNGLIIGLFSIFSFIIGLAAALKLSSAVAERLAETGNKWLPFLSFIIVFIAVAFLVSLGGRLLQKTVEWAMLGWINRLGGMFFYLLLYGIILSIFIFYAEQLRLLGTETREASAFYPYLRPLGPYFIDLIGEVIPVFKNMFAELQEFFGSLEPKI